MEGTQNKTMKTCSSCGAEIAKSAKACPKCGAKNKKPVYKRGWFIALVAVILIGAAANMGADKPDAATPSSTTNTSGAPAETQKPVEYTAYNVSELVKDLDSNAMKAEEKYNDAYVTLTGKLYNIDSDGKYISLEQTSGDFTLTTVQCFIKDDEQKAKIMEMSVGDTVVLNGQITGVGEVLGYTLDIDSIQ